ncbi:MAG: flagellar hook-basal body complex protein FliE [Gammaproteobacteria bacterium]
MNDINMDSLLIQMRAMAERASSMQETSRPNTSNGPDFSNVLKDAVNQVNETQKAAGELKTQFEMGNPDVDIVDVMLASQKSSLSFQAMTQVRNKLVSAYQEIMNMQV